MVAINEWATAWEKLKVFLSSDKSVYGMSSAVDQKQFSANLVIRLLLDLV